MLKVKSIIGMVYFNRGPLKSKCVLFKVCLNQVARGTGLLQDKSILRGVPSKQT